jgi:hydrogenase maturation protease
VTAPLLVIAVGNPSRGDDALGPALVEQIDGGGGDVECLVDFQLQPEHALDLAGRSAVLFVDAARPGYTGGAGVLLAAIQAADGLPALSHALSPAALLHVAQRIGQPLPRAWQLAIEGESFDLGQPLSAAGAQRLPLAVEMARAWIARQRR